MANVQLNVKSELEKVVAQLERIKEAANEVSDTMGGVGKSTGKRVGDESKKVETMFSRIASSGRRLADQLRSDFKTLLSLQSLQAGLSLSNQFGDSLKQTVSLSDSIKKFGTSLGIARQDFAKFQSQLTKGMGEIGMSSEEAADTIRGLAGTGVEGAEAVTSYSKSAAQLASLGGERGRAGDIAGMIASVVRAQGKNVNDPVAMQAVARSVSKAMEGTGKSASEVLTSMKDVFEAMPSEMRKAVTPEALASYAAAETVGGPGATSALKSFLTAGQFDPKRLALEAQGFGKVFTKEGGLDVGELKKFSESIKQRGLDFRSSLKTAGFSEQEAEGLVRLTESADRVAQSMEKVRKASDDYEKKARQNMTLQEAFQSNVNKVKAMIAEPLSKGTQGITDLLGKAGETEGGAAAVVAGGAALSAILAGGGLRGIGKVLGGGAGGLGQTVMGQAKRGVYEELTGRKVQDVYVVNASEIGGSVGDTAGKLAGLGGKLATVGKAAGGVGLAASAGLAIGGEAEKLIDKYTQGRTQEGFEGSAIERLIFKLDKLVGGEASQKILKGQEVNIKLSQGIEKTRSARGASYGPSR